MFKRLISFFDFGLSIFGIGPQAFVLLWPDDTGYIYFFKITPRAVHTVIGRLDIYLRWV